MEEKGEIHIELRNIVNKEAHMFESPIKMAVTNNWPQAAIHNLLKLGANVANDRVRY